MIDKKKMDSFLVRSNYYSCVFKVCKCQFLRAENESVILELGIQYVCTSSVNINLRKAQTKSFPNLYEYTFLPQSHF